MIWINGQQRGTCFLTAAIEEFEGKPEALMSGGEAKTAYDNLGGAVSVEALARRFYEVMDHNPAYAALRAMHGQDLEPVEKAFAGFLSGWLGGPRDWLAARDGFCIMSRHAGMGITQKTAQQWLDAMREAMNDHVHDTQLYTKMDEAFTRLAEAMVGRTKG